MVTKLTLTADEEVVKSAKQIAAEQKTSVSALFDRFVRSVSRQSSAKPVGRLTRKATGLISLPRGKSERKLLERAFMDKYGL